MTEEKENTCMCPAKYKPFSGGELTKAFKRSEKNLEPRGTAQLVRRVLSSYKKVIIAHTGLHGEHRLRTPQRRQDRVGRWARHRFQKILPEGRSKQPCEKKQRVTITSTKIRNQNQSPWGITKGSSAFSRPIRRNSLVRKRESAKRRGGITNSQSNQGPPTRKGSPVVEGRAGSRAGFKDYHQG